jgi:hypothetical protein
VPIAENRPAPAVALPDAPMPLGLGVAQLPTHKARSHDAATAYGISRGVRGPRRGGQKVAQSGTVSGVFRASVHHLSRGPVRGRYIHHSSWAMCHDDRLVRLRQQRGGSLRAGLRYILRHFRSASSGLPQKCRPDVPAILGLTRLFAIFFRRSIRGSWRPDRRLTAGLRRLGRPRSARRESVPARRAGASHRGV